MAKIVTKFKYLKPDRKQSAGGYAKYIATREGVEKIDESKKFAPVTVKQQKLIEKLVKDFPDSVKSLEYQDYLVKKTIGTASEYILRTIEENSYEIAGRETYAKYIATRPRAEKFGRHGLFTNNGVPVSLTKVQSELNKHKGNIWTAVISLRREDAERLDFNRGARWRDMLRTQTEAMASNFKIDIKNLRWYAAFHNESHHPHVHLIVYSTNSKEGYLTEQGIENLRSAFAREIFAQDLISIYAKQTESRDKLRADSKSLVAEIVSQINSGDYDNPTVEKLLRRLSDKLSRVSGKKQYGYLKAEVKDIVDNIIIELSKDERIASLYDMWYEQKEETARIYSDTLPKRIPLVDNDVFKPIKNQVIAEALKIESGSLYDEEFDSFADSTVSVLETVPDEPMVDTESADFDELDKRVFTNRSWWTKEYKQARRYLYGNKKDKPDFKKAMELLLLEAEKGSGFAIHDLGKMYLNGLGVPKDESMAEEYFAKALRAFLDKLPSEKKPAYMQYRIGKMYQQGYITISAYAKLHRVSRVKLLDDIDKGLYTTVVHKGSCTYINKEEEFKSFDRRKFSQKPEFVSVKEYANLNGFSYLKILSDVKSGLYNSAYMKNNRWYTDKNETCKSTDKRKRRGKGTKDNPAAKNHESQLISVADYAKMHDLPYQKVLKDVKDGLYDTSVQKKSRWFLQKDESVKSIYRKRKT